MVPEAFDEAFAAGVGKYRLIARLGRGGMAEVFLAAAEGISRFNKLVVIKRLLWEDEPLRQMLLDEARIAAMLNHPNVVDTYEVGVHGGSHFIAMEYLEGQPLNHIISRARDAGRTLDPAMCVRIVVDALLGLHYARATRLRRDAAVGGPAHGSRAGQRTVTNEIDQ